MHYLISNISCILCDYVLLMSKLWTFSYCEFVGSKALVSTWHRGLGWGVRDFKGSAQPKLGELSLHEVRYENYVDEETNETIEIKRQVYYDDSDLISPPEEEEVVVDSPVKQVGFRAQRAGIGG